MFQHSPFFLHITLLHLSSSLLHHILLSTLIFFVSYLSCIASESVIHLFHIFMQHHDDSLFNYLNSLSPLNPPAMDYSLFTSPNASSFEESTFLIARDNLLDTSNPQVSSQNVPTYSTQDCDYNNLISTTQSLMDTNPIQTGNHEVTIFLHFCIACHNRV